MPTFLSADCYGKAFSEALHTAVLVLEAIVCDVPNLQECARGLDCWRVVHITTFIDYTHR